MVTSIETLIVATPASHSLPGPAGATPWPAKASSSRPQPAPNEPQPECGRPCRICGHKPAATAAREYVQIPQKQPKTMCNAMAECWFLSSPNAPALPNIPEGHTAHPTVLGIFGSPGRTVLGVCLGAICLAHMTQKTHENWYVLGSRSREGRKFPQGSPDAVCCPFLCSF